MSKTATCDMLEVAKLGKVVGLKGALRLHNLSDFLAQFKAGAVFKYRGDQDKHRGEQELKIKSFEPSRSLVIFEGFESPELAKNLVNNILYRSIDDTRKHCKLGKDEYFYFDIIGCEVSEEARILGVVKDILEVGAGFLFCVKTSPSLQDDFAKEFFIPYNDYFILSVDIKNKKITTQNAFGILENS
nr:ribosome maturation factor RimM [uncultured Campylobacter sp.]